MKKQTKKLIAAGIVVALSCGTWGSAQAATFGIRANENSSTEKVVDIDGNVLHPNGKIENVDVGVYAGISNSFNSDLFNENKDKTFNASYTLNNISIIANQYGAQTASNGKIFIGNEKSSEVTIKAIGNDSIKTVNGLYAYARASQNDAAIAINGKKINIVAEASSSATGAYASGNGQLAIGNENTDNTSILAKASQARAVDNRKIASVFGKNIKLEAIGDSKSYGIYADKNAKTNIGNEETEDLSIKVIGGGTGTYGVETNTGANTNLQAQNLSINVTSSTSGKGIDGGGNTTITTDDASLNVTGKGATGIWTSGTQASVKFQAKNTLTIHADGTSGTGVAIQDSYGKVDVTANVLNVSAKGNIAYTVNAQSKADIELGNGASELTLTADGTKEAYVINGSITSKKVPGNVKIGENAGTITIDSKAKEIAHGIDLSDGTNLTVGGTASDISIRTHAEGQAIGVLAMQLTPDEKAKNKLTSGGSIVTINGKSLVVDTTSDTGDATGIWVQNSSTPESKDDTEQAQVNVKTENTTINANTAFSVLSQGILNVNSNLVTNGENAILTRGNSDVNINTDGKHTTQLNGDIVFDYSDTTGVDSNVNVNLSGADSSWTGNTKVTWESQSGRPDEEKLEVSGMKLNVANGAQWNPVSIQNSEEQTKGTAEVALNQLHLDNGVVNLDSAKLDEESVVSVQNISGTGTINTNAFDNMMEVENKEKNTTLTVHGTGAMADEILADTTGKKAKLLAATVVTTNDEIASDKITTDAGVISGAISADVDENGNLSNYTRAVNPSNQAISNMATISLMTWRQENNDMNKRLGELRASQGSQGVWARMARGQAKYGEQSIKNQYNYYQLGYDSKISDDWILGGAFTYTDGESSYTNGSGTNKHTGFAIYGSNLRDDGSFIDIIAKYAHMKNDFDVNGGVEKGDYSTNGYALSAEYGKRFHQDGFWIEPQAELTYGKVSSVDFQTKNGASVHQDSLDSLVGRLGFSLGKDIKQGNVYVRASYLYDFQGDASITMMKDGAATPFRTDIGGSWWEFGVGTNLNLGKDTHFYLDVETTAGGDVDTPWQWNAGVRFSF